MSTEFTAQQYAAMARLARLCHRAVWLNPHKGDDPGFRPSTLGMMVAPRAEQPSPSSERRGTNGT